MNDDDIPYRRLKRPIIDVHNILIRLFERYTTCVYTLPIFCVWKRWNATTADEKLIDMKRKYFKDELGFS